MRQKVLQSENASSRGVFRPGRSRKQSNDQTDGQCPRGRLIPQPPAMDPVCWNKEVVRALATRLPGGKSQVTTECKICKSVFYPCLCPGEDKLVAPKIVEVAEARRIGKCQMGHLGEMRKLLDNIGMDKEVIHVIGPAQYNDNKAGLNSSETCKLKGGKAPTRRQKAWNDFDESGLGSSARKILWREGDIYVISDPDAKKMTQQITLSHEEFLKLTNILHEFRGEMIIDSSKPGKEPIKKVKVLYETREDAIDDLQMQPVKEVEDLAVDGDGSRPCWEVKDVSKSGLASKHELCMGQRLVSFGYAKLQKTMLSSSRCQSPGGGNLADPENFSRLDLDAGQEPWSYFLPATHASGWDEYEEIFPCELVFDQLIPRSCVRHAREPGTHESGISWISPSNEFNMDLAEQLLAKAKGAELWIDWQMQERIDRNEYQIRHQHWSESPEEEDTQIEVKSDLAMYRAWVAEHRMTPGHLSFVFNKLESAIKNEMANFEESKRTRLELLICKSISAAALEKEIKDWEDDEEFDPKHLKKEERRWLKQMQAGLAICIRELHTLFDSVPLYFLRNDIAGKLEDEKPVTDRRKSQLKRQLTDAQLPNSPRPPRSPPPKNHARRRARTLGRANVADGMSQTLVGDSKGASKGKDMPNTMHKEGVQFLKKHVQEYLDGRKGTGRDARITADGPRVVLPSHDLSNEEGEDGRLSPKEFEKVLIMSGMHWVSTAEANALFDSMDTDKSGKLNLGELLSCATRMARLLQRLQAYQQEQIQAGRILDTETLVQEFETILEMGDDLVGSKSRPWIPDSKITASSYFLDRPAYGRDSMWRSRLDCVETCWVGEDEQDEQDSWIQWEFPNLRSITALVTMGRPDADCWVKEFELLYTSMPSESDDSDVPSDDPRWEHYHVNGKAKIFPGNNDRNTRKEHILEEAIGAARIVRLRITKFHGRHPSLRASLYGLHHESAASRKRRSQAEPQATASK